MKTIEVINKLQELVNKNGDVDFHIFNHEEQTTHHILEGDIAFNDSEKDIYIGISTQ